MYYRGAAAAIIVYDISREVTVYIVIFQFMLYKNNNNNNNISNNNAEFV